MTILTPTWQMADGRWQISITVQSAINLQSEINNLHSQDC